jgi:hypothetical protein
MGVLEEANIEIGRALVIESRRRSKQVHLSELIGQIDALLWELEGLNLEDRKVVPDEMSQRITLILAEATETEPRKVEEVREPLLALDRLFEIQGGLTKQKCLRQGFVIIDEDDGDEPALPAWVGRSRAR